MTTCSLPGIFCWRILFGCFPDFPHSELLNFSLEPTTCCFYSHNWGVKEANATPAQQPFPLAAEIRVTLGRWWITRSKSRKKEDFCLDNVPFRISLLKLYIRTLMNTEIHFHIHTISSVAFFGKTNTFQAGKRRKKREKNRLKMCSIRQWKSIKCQRSRRSACASVSFFPVVGVCTRCSLACLGVGGVVEPSAANPAGTPGSWNILCACVCVCARLRVCCVGGRGWSEDCIPVRALGLIIKHSDLVSSLSEIHLIIIIWNWDFDFVLWIERKFVGIGKKDCLIVCISTLGCYTTDEGANYTLSP